MKGKQLRAILVLAITAMTVLAGSAAKGGVSSSEPAAHALVYTEGNILLLTGPPLAQGCFDEGYTESVALHRRTPSGNELETVIYTGEPLMLFEYDGGDPFEWLAEVCGAIAEGADEPEPFATGTGRLIFQLRWDGDTVHIHDAIVGKVTDVDGQRWHVNAWAKFTDGPAGFDLTALRINLKKTD